FVDYPLKVSNVLRTTGLLFSFHAMLGYAWAQIAGLFSKPSGDELSMGDAYIQQFGKVLYETFFKRYSEKVWGRDCRELSADWVAQRTKGLSILTAVRDALFKPKEKVQSLIENFKYPKLGYMRIPLRMAEVIAQNRGAVRLEQAVTAVVHENKTVKHIVV